MISKDICPSPACESGHRRGLQSGPVGFVVRRLFLRSGPVRCDCTALQAVHLPAQGLRVGSGCVWKCGATVSTSDWSWLCRAPRRGRPDCVEGLGAASSATGRGAPLPGTALSPSCHPHPHCGREHTAAVCTGQSHSVLQGLLAQWVLQL